MLTMTIAMYVSAVWPLEAGHRPKDEGPGPDSVTASFPVEEQRVAVAVQVDTRAQEAVQLAGALKHEVGTELQRQLQEMVSRNDFAGAGRVQAEIRRLADTAAQSLAVGRGGAGPCRAVPGCAGCRATL